MAVSLDRKIWVIPLTFAALLAIVGGSAYRHLQDTHRDDLRSELKTLLEADVTALRVWIQSHLAAAQVQAEDAHNRALFEALSAVAASERDPREALLAAPAREELTRRLSQVVALHQYTGFGVIAADGTLVASTTGANVGKPSAVAREIAARVMAGRATVTKPGMWRDPGAAPLPEDDQVMLVLAPIRDAQGVGVGAVGFGISALLDFSRILKVARMGASGETYAFNSDGTMLSESRFDEQLVALGLLAEGQHSAMRVQVRDPGGDLTQGYTPMLPLLARPLTKMAASAIPGEDGDDVDGYPDYRGVAVIGAWTWLEDLEMGIATEIDVAEAYAAVHGVRLRLLGVVALLVVAGLALFVYSAVLLRLRRRMDRVQQLGRYRILEKIGEGGMGAVYRAQHALLRRPTAVKLLHPEKSNAESIARFEREVQEASSLTHPNTIAIYDYGHTPDGIFYYAMEYLEGATLGQCVQAEGAQPEERVLHLMRQACGSIAEAHGKGLIHRDLKPANIMLCERGGLHDFVKVLDFGLVRLVEQSEETSLTGEQLLSGTPRYMSPEAIEAPGSVDARSDIYQLGAIAYYLLAGRDVFEGSTVVEVLSRHLNATPEPIAEVRGSPVSPELEQVVMRCLAKDPADRYENAAELLAAFEACTPGEVWSEDEAKASWLAWSERPSERVEAAPLGQPSSYEVDLDERLAGRRAGPRRSRGSR